MSSHLLHSLPRLTLPILALVLAFPAAAKSDPKILGVAHAAFYVHDLGAARRFYEDFLGYDEAFSTQNAVWIRINDTQSVVLEAELAAKTDRLAHYALATDDAEGMRRYLSAKGIDVPAQVDRDESGSMGFEVHDPDGTPLRFVQLAADGPLTRPALRKAPPVTPISNHISHFGVQSRQLERSLHFYRDLLGGVEFWRGGRTPNTVRWVMVRFHDGADWTEIVVNPGEPTLAELGAWHHICLLVPDAAETLKLLQSRKLPAGVILSTKVDVGTDKKRQIHAFDPNGTRIEIMEPAPR